jgi:hypothetical protein
MKGHGAKFSRKKEEAIAALLSHKSVEDAARAAGLNPNTLLRWLQMPEFRAAYLKARREAVHQAVARLQQASGVAGTIILKLMTDPNVPAAVRLRAAESVLAHSIKGIEVEDILERLPTLEEAAPPENRKDERDLQTDSPSGEAIRAPFRWSGPQHN